MKFLALLVLVAFVAVQAKPAEEKPAGNIITRSARPIGIEVVKEATADSIKRSAVVEPKDILITRSGRPLGIEVKDEESGEQEEHAADESDEKPQNTAYPYFPIMNPSLFYPPTQFPIHYPWPYPSAPLMPFYGSVPEIVYVQNVADDEAVEDDD